MYWQKGLIRNVEGVLCYENGGVNPRAFPHFRTTHPSPGFDRLDMTS